MTDTPTVSVAPQSGTSIDTPTVSLLINLPRGHGPTRMQALPVEVKTALRRADRTSGWNFRRDPLQRFRLGTCELIVVPAQCWAMRRGRGPAVSTGESRP